MRYTINKGNGEKIAAAGTLVDAVRTAYACWKGVTDTYSVHDTMGDGDELVNIWADGVIEFSPIAAERLYAPL